MNFESLHSPLVNAALDAGDFIMQFFRKDLVTEMKKDGSLVTNADKGASHIIRDALNKITPHIPVVCEERENPSPTTLNGCFWCVDPLDGTHQFIRGEEEFTVNIGLIFEGNPVMGVIYHPPSERVYIGYENKVFEGLRDNLRPHHSVPSKQKIVLGSKLEETDTLLEFCQKNTLEAYEHITVKSSLKFFTLLQGEAELWYRSRRSFEWDTAAGHALLNAAGGKILTFEGNPLTYGKDNFENSGFVAYIK